VSPRGVLDAVVKRKIPSLLVIFIFCRFTNKVVSKHKRPSVRVIIILDPNVKTMT